jgi:uncharacterized protein (TIGR02268 family)
MRNFLPPRSALLVVLLASVAMASGREVNVRRAYIFGRDNEQVDQLYVTPDAATVLRFQQPCDPSGTKMLGWEGRFEPIACAGKSVIVVPLQALDPEDRFLLVVRLADGTEAPFTLLAAGKEPVRWPDQQVNVFFEPDSREALQDELKATRERERKLEEATYRHYKEDTADYALAKLLSTGAVNQTPFVERKKRLVKAEDGTEMVVRVYAGKAKAAVLFTVTNRHPSKSWSLSEARLVTIASHAEDPRPPFLFGEARLFAMRADRDEIAPGETGMVAIVVDRTAFDTESGLVNFLALEIYRQDGLLATHVVLDRRLVRE